jgi:CxxC motif-containing protein (DUF1111 family)
MNEAHDLRGLRMWPAVARLAFVCCLAAGLILAALSLAPAAGPYAAPAAQATVEETGRAAFTQHLPELTDEQLQAFALGNRVFSTSWVEAPASVVQFDGLGPYYSRRSSSSCHMRDGRGTPPSGARGDDGIFVVGLAREVDGTLAPDPKYGEQLSESALPGIAPEGHLTVRWTEQPFRFPDGEVASLRSPSYEVHDLPLGPLALDTRLRPRLAPSIPGVGLLEAIPDSAILAREDPDDLDGDGISGRVRRVPDGPEGQFEVGRFGWKADQATIVDQVARALRLDMGITSDAQPTADLAPAESLAAKRPEGGHPEIDTATFSALVDYCAMLAVPARRNTSDARVVRGGGLFATAGCTSCHGGTYTTDGSEFAALSRQRIEPGTDLLLHDMGQGLAESVSDHTVTGAEWRTPPLWGLGLHARVTGHRYLLHDGRARTLTEAILWHGGEARASRDRFIRMDAADRHTLLDYLESL